MVSTKAVAKLYVVEAPSSQAAIRICQADVSANGTTYVVGVDWKMGQGEHGVVHLCVQRQFISTLADSAIKILQRVGVFTDSSACPPAWDLIYTPRERALVCAKFTEEPEAFASFNFIADVDVSYERFYGDGPLEWSTLPQSVHSTGSLGDSSTGDVFLSVRRPMEPITEIRVLRAGSDTALANACNDQLGAKWSQIDVQDEKTLAVICVRRESQSSGSEQNVLSELLVDDPSHPCAEATQVLTDSVSLCPSWAKTDGSYIADLILVCSLDAEASSVVQAAVAAGMTSITPTALSLSATSGVTTQILVRRASRPTFDPAPQDAGLLEAKPPLTASLVRGNSTLSFKILQLADLHFTGRTDYSCRSPPASMGPAPCTESEMAKFVEDLLDLKRPNFVVFSGDNVDTVNADDQNAAMDAVMRGVAARNIPFGLVFRNHDEDAGLKREDLMRLAMSKPNCYAAPVLST